MKNLTTYLFVMFMGMFLAFRIVVALLYSLGIDFITVPMDMNFEIILLFLTLISIILVVKRNILRRNILSYRKWLILWKRYI